MRKSKGKNIHTDTLLPSNTDVVSLGRTVEENFLQVCNLHIKNIGAPPLIPHSMDNDMMRWRQMRVRHKKGDYRHTDSEFTSMTVLAQWTVDVNMKLRNQPPVQVQWSDNAS